MASNITVDTLTKGSTTLNTDEIVDTSSNQICKAWVNFNGEGTVAIRDSYNVASITDYAVGQYGINLTNAMANANYSIATTARNSGDWGGKSHLAYGQTPTTSAFRIEVHKITNAGTQDSNIVMAQIFSN